MNATFEELHPRDTSGTFAHKEHSEPELDLGFFDEITPTKDFKEFAEGRLVVTTRAYDSTELDEAIHGGPTDTDNVTLAVVSSHLAVPIDKEIAGPTNKPLLLDLAVGSGSIDVVSGIVVVRVSSPHPYDIDVQDNTRVTVVVERDSTAFIHAQGHSAVTVDAREGSRGCLTLQPPAVGTVIGCDAFGIVHLDA
jgi:hypothetical protein